jgi:hypothetical protein
MNAGNENENDNESERDWLNNFAEVRVSAGKRVQVMSDVQVPKSILT